MGDEECLQSPKGVCHAVVLCLQELKLGGAAGNAKASHMGFVQPLAEVLTEAQCLLQATVVCSLLVGT